MFLRENFKINTCANASEVMVMLAKDFVKLAGVSFVIATPIAWFVVHKWLQSFAFKTELSWWLFIFSGLITLSIALLIVGWQSWRAAIRNPVEELRDE